MAEQEEQGAAPRAAGASLSYHHDREITRRKTAATIDAHVGNEAARTETLKSDEIELGAFATMFVRF
jgi:hypothetical protein